MKRINDPGQRRPEPPPGFMPFTWKSGRYDDGSKGGVPTQLCPSCDHPWRIWSGGGWTDPGARKAYEEGRARGIVLHGAGDPAIQHEGQPILEHWSRYSEGECCQCGCKFWHDFVGDPWQCYYKPTIGQLALFG